MYLPFINAGFRIAGFRITGREVKMCQKIEHFKNPKERFHLNFGLM